MIFTEEPFKGASDDDVREISDEFKRRGIDGHSQIIIDTEGLFSGERQNK